MSLEGHVWEHRGRVQDVGRHHGLQFPHCVSLGQSHHCSDPQFFSSVKWE